MIMAQLAEGRSRLPCGPIHDLSSLRRTRRKRVSVRHVQQYPVPKILHARLHLMTLPNLQAKRSSMNDKQLFETLTLAIPGIVWISDSYGDVEYNNEQWAEFTGMPRHKGLGHGWLDAIHPADAAAFRAKIPLSSTTPGAVQAEIRVRRRDGVYRRHLLNVRQARAGKWIGCAIDAHDWLIAESRDAMHGNILEMVIGGSDLRELLSELCKTAERQIPGATCSILLVDSDEQCFKGGIAPSLPAELLTFVPGVKIDNGVGSCGTAAFLKRDVISNDISTDPIWDTWREAVLPLGFRACWSKPIFESSGQVIASFGFYFKESRIPTDPELQELARLRGLASLAIERARMLEALRESEEHYRYTVEQNPQIPWTCDPQGSITSVSSRWTELTGISQTDALGDGWISALHHDDVERTLESWRCTLSTGEPLDLYYRVRLQNGEYRWARARATARLSQAGKIMRWYGTVEDVHEQYLAGEKLRRQAYMDDLTDLPNRRRFVEELTIRLRDATCPVGLMVLDMDDFKLVNDRYGHPTGDAVLRLFARYLERIKTKEEFVARLGGDEFAIICANIRDESALLSRARSIEIDLDAYMRKNKKARNCRASIGCAIGHGGETPDAIFNRADLALYAAKSDGKARVKLFTPSIRDITSERSAAFDLVRAALREDWIEPFYQPIVNLADRSIRGFEALLRIRHPDRGILSPFAIKEALDDPRHADAIGIRMVEKVVRDMSSSASAGVACGQISINVATENLVNKEFTCTLLSLLQGKKIPMSDIKLEITERVLMDELGEAVVENLQLLRASGIGISLDDFGTGYASLIHLQKLPVDEIKIDRSFVSALGTNQNGGEIVRAMLGLAHSLNLAVVAEGIETTEEARILSKWGCQLGQGFLFARPLPFDNAVALRVRTTQDARVPTTLDGDLQQAHERWSPTTAMTRTRAALEVSNARAR